MLPNTDTLTPLSKPTASKHAHESPDTPPQTPAPNTGSKRAHVLEKQEWTTHHHIAPAMRVPNSPTLIEPNYTIWVKDEQMMEEHKFRVHTSVMEMHSKFFVAAGKPVYAEGKFGEMTLHSENPMTVHACIEYCYSTHYDNTVIKVLEKYPVDTRGPQLLPFHIDVCALASKWYIDALRHYSFNLFEQTYRNCRNHEMDDKWDEQWGSCLRDAIITAYNNVSTCDKQLHMKLATLVANDIPRLLGNTGLVFAWDQVFAEAPEFCGNLLRALRAGDGVPRTEVQVVCWQCKTKQYFTVRMTPNYQPPRFCPWCGRDSTGGFSSNLIGRAANLNEDQWKMLLRDTCRGSPWARLFPNMTKEEEAYLRQFFN